MIAVQVMANDVAVGFGGAGGYLEMSVYKPLIIYNVLNSVRILGDGCRNFCEFLVEGTQLNGKKIAEYVDRSLMLVTALSPVIGYEKASQTKAISVIAHLFPCMRIYRLPGSSCREESNRNDGAIQWLP